MIWTEALLFSIYAIALIVYGLAMSFILGYGLIQFQLFLAYKKSHRDKTTLPEFIPKVSVQLPIYNEGLVACRLIDAVCQFDYPKEQLEIQVLDDSTDFSLNSTRQCVQYWRDKGVNISHIHRSDRAGFKAGALKEGLAKCAGEFVAIFDADFIPESDFIRKAIPHFQDDKIAVVQTRWGHINRNESLLTKVQALALDMHFGIEQQGRENAGVFLNFNGTAGIWRKSAILDAGNWEADTLTEDLELSYRAQMKGWKIRFLGEIESPAELPADMGAIKSQQHRWNKGGAQVARKHLKTILQSDFAWKVKLHAFFHLLNSSVFVALTVAAFTSVIIGPGMQRWPLPESVYYLTIVFAFAIGSLALNFLVAFRKFSGQPLIMFPFYFFAFLVISMGISLHNARAVFGGLTGKTSAFIRTPKKGDLSNLQHALGYLKQQGKTSFTAELLSGIFFLIVFWTDLANFQYASAIFHGMLGTGFFVIVALAFRHHRRLANASQT